MSATNTLVRVIGIDPGSIVTGYGVIDTDGVRSFHLAHGHIRVVGDSFAERLGHIHTAITAVVHEWRPVEAAIEQVFLSNNAMSALKLGQARGAAVTAVVTQSIEVSEYAARSVKQVVTGSGSADKDRVQTMVKHMLELNGKLQNDAADGLAIALCHAHSRGYGAVAGAVSSAGGGAVSRLPVRRKTRGRGLRR
jgi:crossover junction endodeoxyribonuclease RuvC